VSWGRRCDEPYPIDATPPVHPSLPPVRYSVGCGAPTVEPVGSKLANPATGEIRAIGDGPTGTKPRNRPDGIPASRAWRSGR
jgi:hypothetical protein